MPASAGGDAVGIIARTARQQQPVRPKMASASSLAAAIASKTKTKKKHFVAQKVKLFRASDPLLSVLMWGVNHSVSQTGQTYPVWSTVMCPSRPFFGGGCATVDLAVRPFCRCGQCEMTAVRP